MAWSYTFRQFLQQHPDQHYWQLHLRHRFHHHRRQHITPGSPLLRKQYQYLHLRQHFVRQLLQF
jgi:hypothetical protein